MSDVKRTNKTVAYWATTIAVGTHALLAMAVVLALLPLESIILWWIYLDEKFNDVLPAATVITINLYLTCGKYWYLVPLVYLVCGAVDAWVFHFLFCRRRLRFLAAIWFYLGFAFLLLFVIAIKAGLDLPFLVWLENLR